MEIGLKIGGLNTEIWGKLLESVCLIGRLSKGELEFPFCGDFDILLLKTFVKTLLFICVLNLSQGSEILLRKVSFSQVVRNLKIFVGNFAQLWEISHNFLYKSWN